MSIRPTLALSLCLLAACGEDFAPAGTRVPEDTAGPVGSGDATAQGMPDDDPEPGRRPSAPEPEPPPPPQGQPPPEEQPPPSEDPQPGEEQDPAWVPDNLEPNETCGAGAAIGRGEHLDLTLQQGNPDWYRITLCPAGELTARFAFVGLDGRVEEFLRDEQGRELGGATIDSGGGGGDGSSETGIGDGGRTYCLGYELIGADLRYTLTIEITGCP